VSASGESDAGGSDTSDAVSLAAEPPLTQQSSAVSVSAREPPLSSSSPGGGGDEALAEAALRVRVRRSSQVRGGSIG
jgi:hypothetical protein